MLQKQLIPLNIVQGGDTKINDFIDDSFNVTENVGFIGDLTAKKIDGFEQAKTIPNENFDNLAKAGNDLLAIGETGIYKYVNNQSSMSKIVNLPLISGKVDRAAGDLYAEGITRCCYVSYNQKFGAYIVSVYEIGGAELFTQKVFVGSFNNASYTKLIACGDDFALVGLGPLGIAGDLALYPITTVVGAGVTLTGFNTGNVAFVDIYWDGTRVIGVHKNAASASMDAFTFTWGTFTLITQAGLGVRGYSNPQINECDANHFYLSIVGRTFGLNIDLKIFKINKTTFIAATEASITLPIAVPDPAEGGQVYRICGITRNDSSWIGCLIYPEVGIASFDNDMIQFKTIAFDTDNIPFVPSTHYGFVPTSKPIMVSGNYVFFGVMLSGNKMISCAAKLRSNFDSTTLSPIAVFTQASYTYFDWQSGDFNPSNFYPMNIFQEPALKVGAYTTNGGYVVSIEQERFQTACNEVSSRLIQSGAQFNYFDGIDFTEFGFIGEPNVIATFSTTGGFLPANTYQVCAIFKKIDSKGDVIRSGVSAISTVTTTGSTSVINASVRPCLISLNGENKITNENYAFVEVYIRAAGGFFRLYNRTPISDTSGSFTVAISSVPTDTEFLYTEPNIEENSVPTSAVAMAVYVSRLFYIPKENRSQIRYTTKKASGIAFEFKETFRIETLDKSGLIEDEFTALYEMDGRLIIFKNFSIFYIYGNGPAENGTNNDFGEPLSISTDAGCVNQRSLVEFAEGLLFMSDKGIYQLDRKLGTTYIGAPVEQFNNLTITSAVHHEKKNEVRFTSAEGTTLIYNYFSKQWSWATSHAFVGSCFFKGILHGLDEVNNVLVAESSTSKKYLGNAVIQNITLPWIKTAGIQGFQRLYRIFVLGKYKTPHNVKMRIYYDYEQYYSEEHIISPLAASEYNKTVKPAQGDIESGLVTDGVYQYVVDPERQKCQSFKIEIIDEPLDIANNSGEGYNLVNVSLEVGVMRNGSRLPAAKKY